MESGACPQMKIGVNLFGDGGIGITFNFQEKVIRRVSNYCVAVANSKNDDMLAVQWHQKKVDVQSYSDESRVKETQKHILQ
jgi:hypothetical protein